MNLFQIDEAVLGIINNMSNCFNEETGEIIDEELYLQTQQELEQLQITQEKKIESLACYCKNLQAEVQALETEANAFLLRRTKKANALKRVKEYLSSYLNYKHIKKIELPKAVLSFRKSEVLEIVDENQAMEFAKANKLVRYKEPEIDKTGLKKYLKESGEVLDFVTISEKQNLQIK